MPASEEQSLAYVRQAIETYCHLDVEPEEILPESLLSELNVDSLSLAEMLFALEDRLGTSIVDLTQRPQTVADLMQLIEPFMDVLASKSTPD